jgi:hypothetical protein
MASDEVTPGGRSTVPCVRCGGLVFFVMSGGPNRLTCQSCGATISLDVVHNGRRWTLRRVRAAADPPPSGPP